MFESLFWTQLFLAFLVKEVKEHYALDQISLSFLYDANHLDEVALWIRPNAVVEIHSRIY